MRFFKWLAEFESLSDAVKYRKSQVKILIAAHLISDYSIQMAYDTKADRWVVNLYKAE